MSSDKLPLALRRALAEGSLRAMSAEERTVANNRLVSSYSWTGAKIAWKDTIGHRRETEQNALLLPTRFMSFFEHQLGSRCEDSACYMNDGLPIGLEGTVAAFGSVLSAIVDIPNTSYIFAVDAKWCLTLGMSGDMDFGEKLGGS